jgi:hypothetical protein
MTEVIRPIRFEDRVCATGSWRPTGADLPHAVLVTSWRRVARLNLGEVLNGHLAQCAQRLVSRRTVAAGRAVAPFVGAPSRPNVDTTRSNSSRSSAVRLRLSEKECLRAS